MKPFKRLFFDIETSPNLVYSWSVGRKVHIGYENIVKERAIICLCYKFEGEKQVKAITWENGDDRPIIEQFAEIISTADEVIGHNSDNFDIKWFRTRCIFHGVNVSPFITSIDTLKESRRGFRFNSNRLDYIGKFLNIGGKMETSFDLWKKIEQENCKKSMDKMVRYCKNDVLLLESVYQKMKPYIKVKTNCAVKYGRSVVTCPECLSEQTKIHHSRVSAAGTRSIYMRCNNCNKNFTIPEAKLNRHLMTEYVKEQLRGKVA